MELLLVLLLSYLPLDNFKKPLKLLEKHEYQKTREFLDKELEKDSIAPGYKYLYSLYFLDTVNTNYDLDSSYLWIQSALMDYENIDEKELKDFDQVAWSKENLISQKALCDSLGFRISELAHTEAGYQVFLDKFPTSKQVFRAMMNRDALAFNKAQSTHTFESYRTFLDKYPYSEQAVIAEERYEDLLFKTKTGDGSLVAYEKFYAEFPDSPFRKQALEEIFEIATAGHQSRDYLNFKNNYPTSTLASKAFKMAAHLTDFGSSAFQEILDASTNIQQRDSLQNLFRQNQYELLPFFNEGKFGFLSLAGDEILPATYDFVNDVYFCGPIADHVLIISESNTRKIINRRGTEIARGNWEDVFDLGYGLLDLKSRDEHQVWHKSGFQVLPGTFEQVTVLGSNLLFVRNGSTSQIFTFGGRLLYQGQWDNVESVGDFALFWKGERFALSTNSQLNQNIEQPKLPELAFIYDDYELLTKSLMQVIRDENEGVVGSDLDIKVPLNNHSIYEVPGGWIVESDTHFTLYDENFTIDPQVYENIVYNKHWLGLQIGDRYKLKSLKGELFSEILFDSLRLIGENIALSYENQGTTLIFPNKVHVGLKQVKEVQLLRLPNVQSDSLSFLYLTDSLGGTYVFDPQGEQWPVRNLADLKLLSKDFFSFKRSGKVGLASNQMIVQETPKFDGIEDMRDGYLTVLNRSKFGLLRPSTGINIKPYYDRKLKVINNDAFLAFKSGTFGVISSNNSQLLKFEYQQAEIWSDSILLVRKDDFWQMINIYTGETYLEGVESFRFITTDRGRYLRYKIQDRVGLIYPDMASRLEVAYDDIYLMETSEYDIFIAEKSMIDDEIRVSYFNADGVEIIRQFFPIATYERVVCGG